MHRCTEIVSSSASPPRSLSLSLICDAVPGSCPQAHPLQHPAERACNHECEIATRPMVRQHTDSSDLVLHPPMSAWHQFRWTLHESDMLLVLYSHGWGVLTMRTVWTYYFTPKEVYHRIFIIAILWCHWFNPITSNYSPSIYSVKFLGSEFVICNRDSCRSLLRRCTFLSSNSGCMIPSRNGADPLQRNSQTFWCNVATQNFHIKIFQIFKLEVLWKLSWYVTWVVNRNCTSHKDFGQIVSRELVLMIHCSAFSFLWAHKRDSWELMRRAQVQPKNRSANILSWSRCEIISLLSSLNEVVMCNREAPLVSVLLNYNSWRVCDHLFEGEEASSFTLSKAPFFA